MLLKLLSPILVLSLISCGEVKTKRDRINPVENPDQTKVDSPKGTAPESVDQEKGDNGVAGPLDGNEVPREEEQDIQLPEVAEELLPVIEAAKNGPELAGIKLSSGRKWTVKQATVVKSENSIVITGELLHHQGLLPKDKVQYEFEFVDGEMTRNEFNIAEGEWLPIASQILGIVGAYAGVPIPVELITDIIAELETTIKGQWDMDAQKLATIIALQLLASNL